MSPSLELNRLAIHYVDRNADGPVYAPREQDVATLHPTIVDFIVGLVSRVWDAEDTGSTRSGHFVPDDHERLGPSVTKQCVGRILDDDAGFFDASKDLALRLYRKSHPRASPGVLAVMRLVHVDEGSMFVAILKIRHTDRSFVRVLSDALTHLEVEQVENMLLRDIQKGAIVPHPYRHEYDLKVVDQQADDDPARYFTEDFLGCLTKKSDEHQVRKLLPELEKYARKRRLPLTPARLPRVVTALQERGEDVTTDLLVEMVQKQAVFGPGFRPDDFRTYVERESELGALDIPKQRFARRGKTAERPRRVVYRFHDPKLQGVTLSGPPETLARLVSVDGDTVTFSIQTVKDGFHVDYR
jgi:hypothetical protein